MAETELLRLFGVILSTLDQNERKNAEKSLEQFQATPGFGLLVSQVLFNNSVPNHLRQLAAISLKKYVKEHWSREGKHFSEPEIAREEKQKLKVLLTSSLSEQNSKIRAEIATVIASIIGWEWPEEWPTALQDLVTCLNSTDVNLFRGALKCLDIYVNGKYLTDQAAVQLIPLLFPACLAIFSSQQKLPDRIRMRCVTIVHTILEWVSVVKTVYEVNWKQILSPFIPQWLSIFQSYLNSNTNLVCSDYGIRLKTIEIVSLLVEKFPSFIQQELPQLLVPIWTSLVNGFPVFEKELLNGEEGDLDQDSDGEVFGFQPYLVAIMRLVISLVRSKKFRSMLQPNLLGLVELSINYLCLTQHQMVLWSSDPNSFVSEEEDEFSTNTSVRNICLDLIADVVHKFSFSSTQQQQQASASQAPPQSSPNSVIPLVLSAAAKKIEIAKQQRQQGNPIWWRMQEAVMFLLGHTLANAKTEEIQSHLSHFSLAVLFPILKDADMSQVEWQILSGRSLWFFSRTLR
eukprot:TRINITY_DN5570_c0_g1_i1.p1 TRINITY_DN5570_c0_g1~~TRINITY_DN5570_c0_g1_i1.p1  ORF type:complete len:515 (-),score=134.30 TRINITY_DN5570_c0_g1_i1:5-1549(-)